MNNALTAALNWMDEQKDSGAAKELHELQEDIKTFETKLAELRAKIDPIMGKIYGGSDRSTGATDEEDLHEEL